MTLPRSGQAEQLSSSVDVSWTGTVRVALIVGLPVLRRLTPPGIHAIQRCRVAPAALRRSYVGLLSVKHVGA